MAEILYGVKKVILTELDPLTQLTKVGGVKCNVSTAQTAELDPILSNGEEKVLRDDDIVLAIARTPDLCYGYDFKFTDATFDLIVASLIEGGTLVYDSVDTTKVIGYDSPLMAQGATMKPFMAEVYVANYRGNSIINYAKIQLNNCSGKAPKMAFAKDFYAPSFEVDAREATIAGLPMKQVTFVDALPAMDTTKPILTMTSATALTKPAPVTASSNELGQIYVVDSDALIVNQSQLQDLVSLHIGMVASIITKGVAVSLATTNLNTDKYKVYAVDLNGNISTGSAVVTLS